MVGDEEHALTSEGDKVMVLLMQVVMQVSDDECDHVRFCPNKMHRESSEILNEILKNF